MIKSFDVFFIYKYKYFVKSNSCIMNLDWLLFFQTSFLLYGVLENK